MAKENSKAGAGKPKGRHPINRLSPTAVKRLGPGRHADGGGLYLVVDESGARRWMLRTMVSGRRRDVGLGGADLVGLAEARDRARELRKVAREGGDPVAVRDRAKRRSPVFEVATRQVHSDQIVPNTKNGKHVAQWLSTLERYAFPVIGLTPVDKIEQADILRVLSPIWTEKPETARRIRQRLRVVLDWAKTAGHREGVNPVDGVERGLARQRDRTRHFKALPWAEAPKVFQMIREASGFGALALRFTILTVARSGEARGARWSEIDLEAAEWRIPEERMKARREHRVPLSEPALETLMLAKELAQRPDDVIFPSFRAGRPLSDMTLSAVLKRLDVDATVHGFRSTFRDWAEETTAFSHEVKEAALAHQIKNRVEAAYRRTDLFEKRRDLMDEWGDFLGNRS